MKTVRCIPSLPWYENEIVTELDPDQSQFTRRLKDRAVDFIRSRPQRPFFLCYSGQELHAVRQGRWKLHFNHEHLTVARAPGAGGKPANFAKMKPNTTGESGIRGIASRHGYEVRPISQ